MIERIGIVGAGAIGCVVGGLLTRAGRDVTLLDQWPEHVETLRRQGLRLSGTIGEHRIAVRALHLHDLAMRVSVPVWIPSAATSRARRMGCVRASASRRADAVSECGILTSVT